MDKLFNGLPLFEAKIDMEDNELGMFCISLVDAPAVERNFFAFNEDKKVLTYKIENEEQRKVFGLVMVADSPIYRRDLTGYEYYITYSKETIALMAEKYFKLGLQNNVDTQHNFELEEGITLTQMFIKNIEKGVNPTDFEDVNDGSLFAEFHIENDEVWNAIKEGTYKGFSLAGSFIIDEIEAEGFNKINKIQNKLEMKIDKIKAMLRKMLAEFGEVATDKGTILWNGDEDLKEGDEVHTIDEEGNEKAVEDGEYTTEDKKVIIIKDGKVESITDPIAEIEEEEEEKPKEGEEPKKEEEEEPKEDEKDLKISELEETIKAKDAEIEALKAKIEELETKSSAKSAEEAFAEIEKEDKSLRGQMAKRGYRFLNE